MISVESGIPFDTLRSLDSYILATYADVLADRERQVP